MAFFSKINKKNSKNSCFFLFFTSNIVPEYSSSVSYLSPYIIESLSRHVANQFWQTDKIAWIPK
jgi:hypothetical protein